MSNIDKPKSSIFNRLTGCPRSGFVASTRALLFAGLAGLALSNVACSDDPEPPIRSFACITPLDQEDKPMLNCNFDYKVDPAILAEDTEYAKEYGDKYEDEHGVKKEGHYTYDPSFCETGKYIYSTPGLHEISVRCDSNDETDNEYKNNEFKLAGNMEVYLAKGENEPYSSHPINSICYNTAQPVIMDPQNNVARLGNFMGYSTDLRCANWFGYEETYNTEIAAINLDCPDGESDCDPSDGPKYLEEIGKHGEISDGWPINLDVKANTHLVQPGGKVTLNVTIQETFPPEQEIILSVLMRGPICGNDIIEPSEECEGTDFNGLNCADFLFDTGKLDCVDCKISTDNCSQIDL